jgi:hypothetical protein
MGEIWAAFVASGKNVIVVGAEIPANPDDPVVITYDQTWAVQKGNRPAAYAMLHQQCVNHLRGCKIDKVLVKASAASPSGMGMAHLEGAEVRGVVASAAAAVSSVSVVSMIPQAQISKHYGDRKVDEYVKDTKFWAEKTTGGNLRAGSRAGAMLIIAEREK